MRKYLFLLCAFVTLTANAQRVSEIEAFKKAQKFLSDKKLNPSRSTTRGEEVYKPYYIFNAEDNKGSIIINGSNSEVLAYSKEASIDENNIPDVLKDFIPLLVTGVGKNWYGGDNKTPDEYEPRSTTRVERIMKYSNQWNQDYPYNIKCPYMPGEYTSWHRNHAPVGCGPISAAQIMNFYQYPKHVGSFNTTYTAKTRVGMNADSTYITKTDTIKEIVPATDFRYDLIPDTMFHSGPFSDETLDALSELCFHVGRAFEAMYETNQTGIYMYKTIEPLKNLYGFEVDEITYKGYETDSMGNTYQTFYPDEDYWNFLDSHLEKGIPIFATGARHAYVIDGRDEYGLYFYYPYYIIIKPSMYVKYADGKNENLLLNTVMNKNIHLVAFYPPNYEYTGTGYTFTAIKDIESKKVDDGVVYNLQGRKVGDSLEGLPKGIYIKDGKKQMVK